MPISPLYRYRESSWTDSDMSTFLQESDQNNPKYLYNITLENNFITILTSTGPNRYNTINFHGSLDQDNIQSQYSNGLTLSEMINIWYNDDSKGEIVGNICFNQIQCDNICQDEYITSPSQQYTHQSYIFASLLLACFVLFALVILITSLSLLMDKIYWTVYSTTQIQPSNEEIVDNQSLIDIFFTLKTILSSEQEKYQQEKIINMLNFETDDDCYNIETIRETLYDKYGKQTFIKHMVASESNENNK